MKIIIKLFVIWIIVAISIYALLSSAFASLNTKYWPEEARWTWVSVMIFFLIMVGPIGTSFESDEKKK